MNAMTKFDQERVGEFTLADAKAWRDRENPDWLVASLRGVVVARRLCRDRSIQTARFQFSEYRSPRYPRTMEHFWGVSFSCRKPRLAPETILEVEIQQND